MLTDEQLKEWRKLANEATPGEWTIVPHLNKLNGLFGAVGIDALKTEDECAVSYHICLQRDAAFIVAARQAVPALLDEVNRLRVEHVHADALGNDMAVIQDAIATGFWNIENIWIHIKTEEGDELARDVKQLWDALMWADFVRSSAYDHWDGFKFTKPAPPTPRKFFEGIDTDTLYGSN